MATSSLPSPSHVFGKGVMPGVAADMPKFMEMIIERPDMLVPILEQDVGGAARSTQIAEVKLSPRILGNLLYGASVSGGVSGVGALYFVSPVAPSATIIS